MIPVCTCTCPEWPQGRTSPSKKYPRSGQATWEGRAPVGWYKCFDKQLLEDELTASSTSCYHFLPGKCSFLLQNRYSLLQRSKWFLRRKQLAHPSGLHPSGEVNGDAGCVSCKSPLQTLVTSAGNGSCLTAPQRQATARGFERKPMLLRTQTVASPPLPSPRLLGNK